MKLLQRIQAGTPHTPLTPHEIQVIQDLKHIIYYNIIPSLIMHDKNKKKKLQQKIKKIIITST